MTGRAILIVLAVSMFAAGAYPQMPSGDALPPGHRPVGQRPGSMMPGHPPIGGMGEAASQPDVNGSLTVRVEQGTKNGPAIGGDPVVVEVYRMGQPVGGKIQGKLDSGGVVVFDPLPAKNGDQALVTVTHAGIPFMKVSQQITTEYPAQIVKLTVNETTEAAPAWRIARRDVKIMPYERTGRAGVSVYETIDVENPTDRVWLGTPDQAGGRVTAAFNLPAGLFEFNVGESSEFNRNSVKYDPKTGRLTVVNPMLPGKSQYFLNYVVLAEGGKAELALASPQVTDQLIVFMPKPLGDVCTVQGLKEKPGSRTGRTYEALAVAPGATFTFQFANLEPGMAQSNKKVAPEDDHGGSSLKTPVAVIAGLLLAVGLGYLLLRPGRKPPQQKA